MSYFANYFPHIQTGPQFRRLLSVQHRDSCERSVKDAISILEKSIPAVKRNNIKYFIYSFLIVLLLVLSYLPSILSDSKFHLVRKFFII